MLIARKPIMLFFLVAGCGWVIHWLLMGSRKWGVSDIGEDMSTMGSLWDRANYNLFRDLHR